MTTFIYIAYAVALGNHVAYMLASARANFAQVAPLAALLPTMLVGCAISLLIFGFWLEWHWFFGASALFMLPLGIMNWRFLRNHLRAQEQLARTADWQRYTAAKPAHKALPRPWRKAQIIDPDDLI